jgi:hypothetical protein
MRFRCSTLLAAAMPLACSSSHAPGPSASHPDSSAPAGSGTVIVIGVQSDDLLGYAQMMHVTTQVNGAAASNDTVLPAGGSTSVSFPWEKHITAPAGGESGTLDVDLGVFDGPNTKSSETIKKLAETHFVPSKTMLLRLHLERRCMMFPFPDGPTDSGAPGPLQGISCTSPMTCLNGLCASDVIDTGQLEPYTADWAAHAPESCMTDGSGPSVVPGIGKTDFGSVTMGQTVQVVTDAEGGHHIWIALRQKNLTQWGSTTTISAVDPQTGVAVHPMSYPYTFDLDQAGYCKLYGVDYQLDNTGIGYTQFLGKPLRLTYKVVDANGATATATADVTVAGAVSP